MMNLVPKYVFFTKGVGSDKKELQSFESALMDAGISHLNIVQVSSILPPKCKEISKKEGRKLLKPGQITFVVLARNCSNREGELISASIGAAKPKDEKLYGYLSEHHAIDENEETTGNFAEDLAASMLAITLGIDFDVDADYDEKREIFHMSDKIVETKSITSTSLVKKDGIFTTVIAAAVFIIE